MTMGVTTRATEPARTHVRVLDASLVFAEALARALGRVGLDAVGETLDRLSDTVDAMVTAQHAAEPRASDEPFGSVPPVLLIDADDVAGLYWHIATLRTCPAPVVLLAAVVTPRLRVVARRLGAKAVLTRETGLDELATVLVSVADGDGADLAPPFQVGAGRSSHRALGDLGAQDALCPPVTERQREILSLMALGEQNDDIATRLDISRHTVRTHVQNLLARLGVNSRLAAVVAARDLGLVDPVPSSSGRARVVRPGQ